MERSRLMAKPYSNDLRRKVLHAIEVDGLPKSQVSQLFHISRNTINLWLHRKAETGDIQPKQRQTPPRAEKITDWEKFRAFVKAHGDKTQAEMAALWEGEISQRTISRALKKIGQSRKKKRTAIANGTRVNGQTSSRT